MFRYIAYYKYTITTSTDDNEVFLTNREISEIVHNKRKVIEFKEIEKIRNQANKQIKESINFKTVTIPAMQFGTTEQRKFFKQILEYKAVV